MSFQDTGQPPAPRMKIGKIASAHGVKGLVKILPSHESITDYTEVFIDETSDIKLKITYKNRLNKYILAEIDGIIDRNQAEELQKHTLYVEKTDKNTSQTDILSEKLTKKPVFDEKGSQIGVVKGIENFGASDLLDIRLMIGKDVMVPLTEDFVTESEDGLIVMHYEAFL